MRLFDEFSDPPEFFASAPEPLLGALNLKFSQITEQRFLHQGGCRVPVTVGTFRRLRNHLVNDFEVLQVRGCQAQSMSRLLGVGLIFP